MSPELGVTLVLFLGVVFSESGWFPLTYLDDFDGRKMALDELENKLGKTTEVWLGGQPLTARQDGFGSVKVSWHPFWMSPRSLTQGVTPAMRVSFPFLVCVCVFVCLLVLWFVSLFVRSFVRLLSSSLKAHTDKGSICISGTLSSRRLEDRSSFCVFVFGLGGGGGIVTQFMGISAM